VENADASFLLLSYFSFGEIVHHTVKACKGSRKSRSVAAKPSISNVLTPVNLSNKGSPSGL